MNREELARAVCELPTYLLSHPTESLAQRRRALIDAGGGRLSTQDLKVALDAYRISYRPGGPLSKTSALPTAGCLSRGFLTPVTPNGSLGVWGQRAVLLASRVE
jgi:hypothetical protein